MRNINRKNGLKGRSRYVILEQNIICKVLIILIVIANVMMIYPVSSILTASASPIVSALQQHNRHSTGRFTPDSQSRCAIGQARLCALNANVITPMPTSTPMPTPTPTRTPTPTPTRTPTPTPTPTSTPTPTALPTPTPTPTRVPKTLSGVVNNPIVNGGSTTIGIKDRNQAISFSFETDVIDNRGSGAGWRLSEGATALQFGANGPTSDLFLDALKPIVVTCATNSTCSSPGSLTIAPLGQDMVTEPITLADAPFLSGLGAFSITTLGYFIIPASANIGQTTGGVITVTIFGAP